MLIASDAIKLKRRMVKNIRLLKTFLLIVVIHAIKMFTMEVLDRTVQAVIRLPALRILIHPLLIIAERTSL
jgi:hypothetical protein